MTPSSYPYVMPASNLPAYEPQEGDAFFFPGTVVGGEPAEGYIIHSATLAAGTQVSVAVPEKAPDANGTAFATRGRFWQVNEGKLKNIDGMYYNHDTQGDPALTGFLYSYHDVITELTETGMTLAHAPGHTGSDSKCGHAFAVACGSAEARGRECAVRQVLADDLTIIDLRAHVLAGSTAAAADAQQVKALCDAGGAVINVYSANGTKESGTASVIVVLDPKDSVTRGEMVQMLYEKAGKPAVSGQIAFADVEADREYANAVLWAVEKGVVSGYGDGTFGPDKAVTMEQLAVMLWNYAGKPAVTAPDVDMLALTADGPITPCTGQKPTACLPRWIIPQPPSMHPAYRRYRPLRILSNSDLNRMHRIPVHPVFLG